jgi:ureidoglycolate lyase
MSVPKECRIGPRGRSDPGIDLGTGFAAPLAMLEDAAARPDDVVLVAQPLTADAFAPFGEVFAVPGDGPGVAINGGTALRYDLPVTIETSAAAARLSFYRVQPARLPLRVQSLERHPLGSQAFVPLSGRPWLVVVAPAGDAPEPGGVRCFLAAPDQGVNYAPGTWHHPVLALRASSDFLVIDRAPAPPHANCDELPVRHWQVSVDAHAPERNPDARP